MKTQEKKHILGKEIHKRLNVTLHRKLTNKEYTELVLLVSGVFDLLKKYEETKI